jgi:hypothetical protein
VSIRKWGNGWQVRVRPFPEITVPTKAAAEAVELDLRLRRKLGHLYVENLCPPLIGERELDPKGWRGGEAHGSLHCKRHRVTPHCAAGGTNAQVDGARGEVCRHGDLEPLVVQGVGLYDRRPEAHRR